MISVALTSESVHAADDWSFLVAPYVWFAGLEGDLSALPGANATEVDVSPADALKGTEASFMLMVEAKKGRQGFLLDVFYSDVLQENQTNYSSSTNWKASVQDTLISAGYTYEVYRTRSSVIDIIAGFRYWDVDTKVALSTGGDALEEVNLHNSQSWFDPLAGVKAKVRLGDSRFYLATFLGVGGASGGADGFYDLTANLGYQLTESIVASVGYRVFDVDYRHDDFVYDVKQEGWVIGVVWLLGSNKLAHMDASGNSPVE